MPELDPYGLPSTTDAHLADDPDQPVPVPVREEELALARGVPESEQVTPSPDTNVSALDPALRLQDGVGTWLEDDGTATQDVGQAEPGDESEPAPQPYAPLADSGGQGI